MIQMDGDHAGSWQKGNRKGYGGQPSSSKAWAYNVDEDAYAEESYDAGDEYHDEQHDVWAVEDGPDDDGLFDDLEEFEQSLEVLVVDSMTTEELEIFAVESQKLARNDSHYAQKRRMVQKGKVNRGFNPGVLSHNRTAVSLDGLRMTL